MCNLRRTLPDRVGIRTVSPPCESYGGDPWATYHDWTPYHKTCTRMVLLHCACARYVSSCDQHALMHTNSRDNRRDLRVLWSFREVAVVPWVRSGGTDRRLEPECWDHLALVWAECWVNLYPLSRRILQISKRSRSIRKYASRNRLNRIMPTDRPIDRQRWSPTLWKKDAGWWNPLRVYFLLPEILRKPKSNLSENALSWWTFIGCCKENKT